MNTETILEEGYVVRNCKVVAAHIFLDCGNLCYRLELSGASFNASVGINTLGSVKFKYDEETGTETPVYLSSGLCGAALMKVMQVCDTNTWAGVVGSVVRVAIKDSTVVMFGHSIIEDMWINNELMASNAPEYREFT